MGRSRHLVRRQLRPDSYDEQYDRLNILNQHKETNWLQARNSRTTPETQTQRPRSLLRSTRLAIGKTEGDGIVGRTWLKLI